MQSAIDNKKIAKNTLYLYLRMLISMAVSLYTSRVIIKVLGIDDFGIYNIVGGVIVMFSFISTSLKNCTQRFLSFQLGKEDKDKLNKVMNVSLLCHFIFAICIVIILLTVGLWFVIEKLNIPEQREHAAIIVYLVSIATFVFNIFQTPYQAAIISHEKMSFYAAISIIDVLFKLVIVFALVMFGGDKLIIYSILMLFVTFVMLVITSIYCYTRLGYERPAMVRDKDLFKQFFSYSGWSMFSGSAYIGAQQGGNILINIFSGVAANGAFGIANQVSSALYGFVSNFQIAFNPQIVKSYSAGESTEMFQLINRASSFGYYIFMIIAIPVLSQIEYLLALWLGDVPEYAPNFCRLLLLYFLVDSIEAPLWMLIGATGKMKVYSLWVGIITLFNIPISWFLLYLGFSVYWVFIVRVLINVLLSVIRPFYLKVLVPSFSLKNYLKEALVRPFIVTIVLLLILVLASKHLDLIHPFISLSITFLLTIIMIWIVGMKQSDRTIIVHLLKNKINSSSNE